MNDYELKKLYEEMELHLIKSMKRNLGKHLLEEKEIEFEYPQWQAIKLKELKRYQKENKKIIGRYVFGLEKDISEHLQNELKQGAINAINQYNSLNKKKLNRNKLMNKSFFKTNDKKVKALIKVVNDDLNIANASALRMINDQYRQIIYKSAFFVGNGVFTEQQAARMAVDEISEKKLTTLAIDEASKNFLAGGLNCIEYKNGRRVNIASYSQMAVRTASLRAQLMGEGDFRKSIGRTLVKVTTHGGACKLCTGWQGKVLVDDVYSGGKADGKHTLLSEAMKQGFLHPNCRHGLTTYYPELEESEEVETENQELQEQINYYNRQEKKYNRLKTGSLNYDNRKIYEQKEIAYEEKKSDYIEEQTMTQSIKNSYTEKLLIDDSVKYNDVEPLTKHLTTEEIIDKVGGGDLTSGSCASVAYAYVGNKAGLDVLDFRGGKSRSIFSKATTLRSIAKDFIKIEIDTNDFVAVKKLLAEVELNKEYLLSTGNHMAIIKKSSNGFEYLELQEYNNNGFKKLTNNVLKERFGCKKTHTSYGISMPTKSELVDIEQLGKNEEFRHLLGYINTNKKVQKKGFGGYAK